jgi:hypothetical protein
MIEQYYVLANFLMYSLRSDLVYILEKIRQISTTFISTTSTNPNYIESSDIQ